MKTKYIETTNYIIDKFLMKDEGKINKYLSYIDIINPLKNKSSSKLYMFSLNENIEEYLSSNYILLLQNLNNNFIKNIFFEELNLVNSSSNYLFIEFLIGFIYYIDKRNKFIENNIEITNEQKYDLLNDKYIKDYIFVIFEIIFNIKNNEISNYYITDGNILIKIKYFFKNNIFLLNEKSFLDEPNVKLLLLNLCFVSSVNLLL